MQARPLSSPAARNLNHAGPSSIAEGPGLAHDAGNLLEALVLYSDLLGMPGVLRPKHQHYARELKLVAQRSQVLIGRLLLERRDGDDLPALVPEADIIARSQPLYPATVVHDFTPLLRSMAAPEVMLTVTIGHHLPQLPFRAEVLERILVNLTRNAITALHGHPARNAAGEAIAGEIHIAVAGNARQLSLTVTDNGPGMSPEMVKAFLRPQPLPPRARAGIGHHVVNELVQSSGGTLSISVVPERQTTLRIQWPIPAPASIPGTVAADPASHMSSSRQTRANHKGTSLPC